MQNVGVGWVGVAQFMGGDFGLYLVDGFHCGDGGVKPKVWSLWKTVCSNTTLRSSKPVNSCYSTVEYPLLFADHPQWQHSRIGLTTQIYEACSFGTCDHNWTALGEKNVTKKYTECCAQIKNMFHLVIWLAGFGMKVTWYFSFQVEGSKGDYGVLYGEAKNGQSGYFCAAYHSGFREVPLDQRDAVISVKIKFELKRNLIFFFFHFSFFFCVWVRFVLFCEFFWFATTYLNVLRTVLDFELTVDQFGFADEVAFGRFINPDFLRWARPSTTDCRRSSSYCSRKLHLLCQSATRAGIRRRNGSHCQQNWLGKIRLSCHSSQVSQLIFHQIMMLTRVTFHFSSMFQLATNQIIRKLTLLWLLWSMTNFER